MTQRSTVCHDLRNGKTWGEAKNIVQDIERDGKLLEAHCAPLGQSCHYILHTGEKVASIKRSVRDLSTGYQVLMTTLPS